MYLERLRLDNYAAIMNGLKTDSVEINFTKFKDKIILIKRKKIEFVFFASLSNLRHLQASRL